VGPAGQVLLPCVHSIHGTPRHAHLTACGARLLHHTMSASCHCCSHTAAHSPPLDLPGHTYAVHPWAR
jgi:hypothetical protein